MLEPIYNLIVWMYSQFTDWQLSKLITRQIMPLAFDIENQQRENTATRPQQHHRTTPKIKYFYLFISNFCIKKIIIFNVLFFYY